MMVAIKVQEEQLLDLATVRDSLRKRIGNLVHESCPFSNDEVWRRAQEECARVSNFPVNISLYVRVCCVLVCGVALCH